MKKIITLAIFTVIIMAFPVGMQAQKVDSVAILQQRLDEMSVKLDALTNQNISKTDAHSISASEADINLNFSFSNNRETFFKALDILGIGFSIVFVVMIIFIFVSSGIDKMFPNKME